MTIALFNEGSGTPRDMVILYHVHPSMQETILASLPSATCVVSVVKAPARGKYSKIARQHIRSVADTREWAHRKHNVPIDGRNVLIGFSEGCQAVRTHLRAGYDPYGVVLLDGTHGYWPKPDVDTQIEPYRRQFARACTGDGGAFFVGTHTALTYVEKLETPYASTKTILGMITGWDLKIPHVGDQGVRREGDAVVFSYPGRSAEAHKRQVRQVLPMVLRTEVAHRLLGGATTVPMPPPVELISLGERCVEWLIQYIGMREEPPGSNSGPFIDKWRAPCVRGYGDEKRLLELSPSNWCAMIQSAAMNACLQSGEPPPHDYRAGVVELVEDAQAHRPEFSGRYRPVKMLHDEVWKPALGDLVVWDRSDPGRAETSWWRHVNRIVSVAAEAKTFQTIGGNENDAVRTAEHSFFARRLLGFIEYPRIKAIREPQQAYATMTSEEYEQLMQDVQDALNGMLKDPGTVWI